MKVMVLGLTAWTFVTTSIVKFRYPRSFHSVRFFKPSSKKAASKFSRKLTPWKWVIAASVMFAGGGPLGTLPPAVSATLSGLACISAADTDEAVRRANAASATECIVREFVSL